ncbi:MAG: energy-coupling factor ABC transporter ATP-binding protein [Candidatus Njordarchaeales archaeon]
MIRLRNVWYRYPRSEEWCIRDLTTEIPYGVNMLVGPNGSGKTTLLRIIAGFYKPQRGYVEVLGKKINSYADNIGKLIYVPSNPKVFTVGPTVEKDIERIIASFNSRYTVKEILDIFHISHLAKKRIYHLSEGEHRVLAIASALASDAEVILMDEPTVGLDKVFRNALIRIINEMGREKIILVATNDLRLVPRCDNILLLNNGQLMLSGSPQKVLYSEIFEEIVGLSEIVEFCKIVGLENIVTPEDLADHLRNMVTRNV